MRPIDDPSSMTPDERLSEVASILATGILRLHAGLALGTDHRDPQKSLDSATAGLELSEKTVLSVQRG